MKQAIRSIIINSLAIALVGMLLPGITYGQSIATLVIAATVLGVANTFIKPVIALILLPINIITLGLAGLFMNTLLLFLVTLMVPQFNIVPFTAQWGTRPVYIPLILSYIICSTAISLTAGILRQILDPS